MDTYLLRLYAASMYSQLFTQARPIIQRPLPGNELILWTCDKEIHLTFRREGLSIESEDLQAVADAFVVPPGVEPTIEQVFERQPVTGRSVTTYYAYWRWIEC